MALTMRGEHDAAWSRCAGAGKMTRAERRARGWRVRPRKPHRRRRNKASEWGLLPLLLLVVVIVLIVLAITGIRLPHSPLLPR